MSALREGRGVLSLTGNFRSGQNICAVAASLRGPRGEADRSRVPHPDGGTVVLVGFPHKQVEVVTSWFSDRCDELGLPPRERVVLAHRGRTLEAAGVSATTDTGGSRLQQLADAVEAFASREAEPSTRLAAVRKAEHAIELALGYQRTSPAPASLAFEQHRRALACELLGHLAHGDALGAGIDRWIERAWHFLGECQRTWPTEARPPSIAATFPRKGLVLPAAARGAAKKQEARTIHRAKGLEWDAVLLVIAGDRARELLDAWEGGADDEPRRVLYVGATRARRLLCVGSPSTHLDRVARLLRRSGAAVSVERVDSAGKLATTRPARVEPAREAPRPAKRASTTVQRDFLGGLDLGDPDAG
jgi:DNA helicase II / ATP-dependent DNA helicase PcrA